MYICSSESVGVRRKVSHEGAASLAHLGGFYGRKITPYSPKGLSGVLFRCAYSG